jgi:hypothetical protein
MYVYTVSYFSFRVLCSASSQEVFSPGRYGVLIESIHTRSVTYSLKKKTKKWIFESKIIKT